MNFFYVLILKLKLKNIILIYFKIKKITLKSNYYCNPNTNAAKWKKKNRYLMSYPFLFCSINYNEDKISTHYPLNKVGLIFFNIKKYLSDYNILKNKKNWNFSYWFEWVSYFFYGKKILIYWEFPQLLAENSPLKMKKTRYFYRKF